MLATPLLSLFLAFQGSPTEFSEAGIHISPPSLENFRETATPSKLTRITWKGNIGDAAISVSVRIPSLGSYGITSPEEVRDEFGTRGFRNLTEPFEYSTSAIWPGDFGQWPYAALGVGQLVRETSQSDFICLAGILDGLGYSLEIHITPANQIAAVDEMRAYLKRAIRYSGPKPDLKWTDEEAEARWERHAWYFSGDLKIRRTKHYIILTNSSGGKLFSKKLEEAYGKIRKVFPFKEEKTQRLLPIILFRTEEQYSWWANDATSGAIGRLGNTKGHAMGDYYATWYDAPGDPVHVHEATHQIFTNVLKLPGGGTWFQEGVAEYMSSRPNARNQIALRVTKEDKFTLRSILASDRVQFFGLNDDNYNGFALAIEFFLESKSTKKKFPELLQSIGSLESSSLDSVDAVVKDIYGMNLDELNKQFVKYCKRR